ncbi:MAG TPA: POTRA domain-containing protein [Longimicrobiales bacterium]|nr:POTRA domain-containing protein [Longimicrobiales bacterium]
MAPTADSVQSREFRAAVGRAAALAAFCAIAAVPATLVGQEPAPCETGRIAHVFIDNHSIFDTSDPELDARFRWAYRTANALHARTDAEVIRRELQFAEGDCLDPFLLAESERLLRDLGFLASVDVFSVRQPDGTHHVIVNTRDEWSTKVDIRADFDEGGVLLRGARLAEDNIGGSGHAAGVFFRQDPELDSRDYGISYFTPQAFGTRWDLGAEVSRTRIGSSFGYGFAYPFVGETGLVAAEHGLGYAQSFFGLQVDDTARVLIPTRSIRGSVGVGKRFGSRGNLTIAGLALLWDDLEYPADLGPLLLSTPAGEATLADSTVEADVRDQMGEVGAVRLAAVFGRRSIRWVQRRGFDTMRGLQDFALGAEIQFAVGRSINILSDEDDVISAVTFYAGGGGNDALFVARARTDFRRLLSGPADAPEFVDLLAEGELLGYLQTGVEDRHTLFFRAAAEGGWNTLTPFQLTLGSEGGLRGVSRDRAPGARRATFLLEDRMYFGWPFRDVLDVGASAFVEAGRMWAGDAPFWRDSDWNYTLGAGLRFAFPAGSRTTVRVDYAHPFGPDAGGGRVLIEVMEPFGADAPFGSPQLARSRRTGLGGAVFRFRN